MMKKIVVASMNPVKYEQAVIMALIPLVNPDLFMDPKNI
jgi:hypothetical protein